MWCSFLALPCKEGLCWSPYCWKAKEWKEAEECTSSTSYDWRETWSTSESCERNMFAPTLLIGWSGCPIMCVKVHDWTHLCAMAHKLWPMKSHSENLPSFGNRETRWTIARKSRLIGAFRLTSVTWLCFKLDVSRGCPFQNLIGTPSKKATETIAFQGKEGCT